MPRSLATLFTFAFIFILFRWDLRKQDEVSGALWLPVLWLVITGSRFVSQWIDLGSGGAGMDEEGALIDVLYFLMLIIAGMFVLARRRVVVGEVMRNNPWLTAFFIYGFLSILWSDFPFIAFKRWFKTLGHPVMALIILTDPDPVNALRTVMKRCAYLMMPLSVLFIKYYPEYGRGFSFYTGEAYNMGITTQKNSLGFLCMIFSIFFFWNFLTTQHIKDRLVRRKEYLFSVGFLYMIGWLLYMADSSTSLSTLVIGVVTMTVLGLRIVSKRFLGTYIIVAVLVAIGAEFSFDVYAKVLDLLGEDPTLTDRTEIWAACIALVDNPIFGMGFESFWLDPRVPVIWEKWRGINQAHSGYIETYLNLGAMGVFLLFGVLFSTFRKISDDLLRDFDFARLRLGYLFAIIFFNYTEATFKALHPLWTVFYIIAIVYPRPAQSQEEKIPIRTNRSNISMRSQRTSDRIA